MEKKNILSLLGVLATFVGFIMVVFDNNWGIALVLAGYLITR